MECECNGTRDWERMFLGEDNMRTEWSAVAWPYRRSMHAQAVTDRQRQHLLHVMHAFFCKLCMHLINRSSFSSPELFAVLSPTIDSFCLSSFPCLQLLVQLPSQNESCYVLTHWPGYSSSQVPRFLWASTSNNRLLLDLITWVSGTANSDCGMIYSHYWKI